MQCKNAKYIHLKTKSQSEQTLKKLTVQVVVLKIAPPHMLTYDRLGSNGNCKYLLTYLNSVTF